MVDGDIQEKRWVGSSFLAAQGGSLYLLAGPLVGVSGINYVGFMRVLYAFFHWLV